MGLPPTLARAIVLNMAEAVYVRDVNRKIIYLNPAAQRLTGWSAADSLGASCYDLFGGEECSADTPCPLEAILRLGGQRASAMQLRGTRDGESVLVRASASWTGRPGGLRGVLVTMATADEAAAAESADEPVQLELDVDTAGETAASDPSHDPEAVAEYAHDFAEAYRDAEVGIALTRLDGAFIEANPALAQMLGRTHDELLALSWAAVRHPDDYDDSELHRETILAGGADSNRVEKRYLRPDGSITWLDVSSFLLRDSLGAPLCFISQARDITERKLAEQKLLDREQDFERAQRLAHAGDWSYDVATGHLVWSDEVYRIFERNPSLGPTGPVEFRQVIPTDAWIAFTDAWAAALEHGTPYRIEIPFQTDSGATRTMVTVCEPVMDEHGKVTRLAGSIVDVTERKEAEQALRDSEIRYRELFDGINAGAVVLIPAADGCDFVIADVNASAERIDRIERSAAIGRPASEVLSGFAESGLREIVQRVAHSGLPDYRPAAPYPDPDSCQWREVLRLPRTHGRHHRTL